VGLRNEGKKKYRLAHFLGPLSGSSFLSIDGPTSLERGEGHLMCLSSVRVSSGGDGDDGGMRTKDQRLILVSNSAPTLNDIDECSKIFKELNIL